jgi:hypothetical protein
MGAYEASQKNSLVGCYGMGFFLWLFGFVLFTPTHPYASGFIGLAFIILGTFFLTVAHVRPEGEVLKYKIWFWRRAIPYHEILECDESWVFGYVKCRSYLFPWGKLYFVRGYADDRLFGWDRKLIASIRDRVGYRIR